jgi:hypothetical protein
VGRVWPRHGHRGRPLNAIVRLHVKRVALGCIASLFMMASSVVGATSCMGPGEGLTRFIEQSVQDAERVILVKVISVSPKGRTTEMPGPSANVRVLKSLKGVGDIRSVEASWLGGVPLAVGDTRVLFTNRAGVIVACTDYRYWLTEEGVVFEVERLLKRRAT